mgnify:CR=1 FL=1
MGEVSRYGKGEVYSFFFWDCGSRENIMMHLNS